ncbi:winged helix-turn-helix domain-containing protein [Paraliomyxa miuraensis]|uniref:winged helix-turn-helix domain-containing protein n=1 Tax=Paraliomyxa miuraensis TaxID=376150 RepID=UPI00224D6D75|nr:winged helix-turn-helix domain-containing protein [Paraliomyxa miuraensis]MCX4245814.1 winged helix-turn-helix domain-containing protein [Paraliomyxa miuraensis]
MTFLEAAIEVLRNADGPLHFSEVAKRAVEGNLLSHVGRDPEAAMQTCLKSAARTGHGEEPLIIRDKPGVYGLRPGAVLPDPPVRPATKTVEEKSSKSVGSVAEAKASDEGPDRKRRRRAKARGEAPAPASVEVLPTRKTTKKTKARSKAKAERNASRKDAAERAPEDEEAAEDELDADALAVDAEDEDQDVPEIKAVEFEAPSGSGLDGVTDVALVMANAMSRLVEERPELRDELDAMQHAIEVGAQEAAAARQAAERAARAALRDRDRERERERERERDRDDERGGRRRRRRRRRGKRVDWSSGGGPRAAAGNLNEKLLDHVAAVLEDAGTRSLHVRQIAETLANKGVLGGEISEIERAVTAAVLLDIRAVGRASRFSARGDARYQLQGTRLPEKAAKAEQALRGAARVVETETREQLIQWLQSLGARALESLVRIHLQREGYSLVSALPPSRGLGKLVVEDPEPEFEDSRLLVLVIPRRTALEARAWDGEAERNHCGGVVMFAMGELDDAASGDARVIGAGELAQWMVDQQVGVDRLAIEVPVIDPTFIESIGGLDT